MKTATRIPIGRPVEHVLSPQIRGQVVEQTPHGYMVRTATGLVEVKEFWCRLVKEPQRV